MDTKIIPLGTVSPYPSEKCNCPGFLIKHGERNFLFDCGSGCTRLLNMKEDLNNLTILITHLHPDHYGDLITLLQTIMVYRKYGYVEGETNLFLPDTIVKKTVNYEDTDGWSCSKTIEEHSTDYLLISEYAKKADVKIRNYKEADYLFRGNPFRVSTLSVPHSEESYALKFDTGDWNLVYSGDTGTDNDLRKFAKDSDILICESTYKKGDLREKDTHLYAHEAAKIARDAEVKKLVLTHFWHDANKEDYVEEAKKVFPNTEAAEEGKVLVFER